MALSVALATLASAGEVFPPTQLTNNSYGYNPEVSGDRVVWQGYDGSDPDIYTWTPASGTVQVTNDAAQETWPLVSGNRVVWWGYDGSDLEVFTWTPAGGTVRITDNAYDDSFGGVSGDRVVWRGEDGSDSEVFTWTPAGGTVQLTNNTYDDSGVEVSGDRVVWGGADGVFTWTPAGGTVQPTNSSSGFYPEVSGDRVVWMGEDGSDIEIFTWTPAGGTVQVTNNGYDDWVDGVSGDRVVWSAEDGSDYEVFTWTPASGVTQLTANDHYDFLPQISGDRIVWLQAEGLIEVEFAAERVNQPTIGGAESIGIAASSDIGANRVYTWTPSGGVVLVYEESNGGDPNAEGNIGGVALSGDRVAWEKEGIYTAVAHTRFDDKSAKITYLPGWARWDNSNYWAAFSDTYAYTDKKGDKVMVTFSGTSASVVACTSNTKGKAQVSLYNGAAEPANLVSSTTVDLYSSSTKWKQRVYSTGTIAAGTHTLVIECLYQKNGASGWYTIDVDGFDILGTLEQSPTLAKIDDKDYAHFTYSPGIAAGASTSQWSRWDNSGYYAASDDTYAYTDQLGFKTSFTFEGTYASWLACTSNTKGQAKVTVDGDTANAKTVDLYSPTTKWKQKVYDTGILTPGPHTVVIECLGTKNPSSWYHTIDVDRFDAMLAP